MNINREKFFNGVRSFLKSQGLTLTQKRVDALEFLVGSFEKTNWRLEWIAYAFATIFHETAATFEPIREYRAKVGSKGRKNQDRYWLSGYYGRGYVQLTWPKNYELFGIADNPDKALERPTAFRILTEGMSKGLFTGKKLGDYINSKKIDYKGSRHVINGEDKDELIAFYATLFEKILKDSATETATQSSQLPKRASKDAVPLTETPSPITLTNPNEGGTPPIIDPPNQVGENTGSTSTSSEITKKTEAETPEGKESVAVSTTVGQNVVIEKRKEESWASTKWKEITGAFATGGALDGITDRATEVQTFGLGERFWTRFFYVAVGALVIYLVSDWWKHHQRIVEGREMDKVLAAANSTPTNFVQFAPTEYLQEYRARGYKVITR